MLGAVVLQIPSGHRLDEQPRTGPPLRRGELPWHRLDGMDILGVVRSHGGIENHGFRPLTMDWQEAPAWCPKGAATDVLGRLRRWVYNPVGLLNGR